eukprot:TRINITY_DN1653_c0_g1_i2.p1 TRINITY_DN1653_c0_g1~~TRINITY_DN1653_c0_g1_i2.p1  ORF type:complete len:358 (-),score=62.10 TRINITY_DN1653_c0_g1_i2:18-1091(-)
MIERMNTDIEKKGAYIKDLEEYKNVCPLKVSYTIIAEDLIVDIEEIYRLREAKREYDILITREKREHTAELSAMKTELFNVINKHKNEMAEKGAQISELVELNKVMEERIDQLLKGQNCEANTMNKERMREDVYDKNDETYIKRNLEIMTVELEGLLARYRVAQAELRKRDLFIATQAKAVEALRKEDESKNAEILHLQQMSDKLASQYKELKKKLLEAHQKVRELNFGVISDMKLKLIEKDKTIHLLKKMVKGNSTEIKNRVYDVIRFNKDNEAIKDSEKPIFNKELLSNYSISPKKIPLPDYQSKYFKKVENFYDVVKCKNYRNNSVNVRKLLNYKRGVKSVSYTHLTLPTNREV